MSLSLSLGLLPSVSSLTLSTNLTAEVSGHGAVSFITTCVVGGKPQRHSASSLPASGLFRRLWSVLTSASMDVISYTD